MKVLVTLKQFLCHVGKAGEMICVFAVALRNEGKKKISHFSSHFFSQLDYMFKLRPPNHSRVHTVLSENQLTMFSRGGAASLASH